MYDVPALIDEPMLLAPLAESVSQGTVPAYLRSVKVKLTARCNLRCQMCRYGRGRKPPELPTERWLQLIDEMADLGCRKIHFSGGEVMLRDDLAQLAGRASKRRMKVTLTSNLTLLTRRNVKELLRCKLSGLSTSLDGASPKMHDSIRGIDGSFKRTLRSLRLILRTRRDERHPRVRVNFVMMRRNFADYPALVAIAAEHGACDVVPMPVDTPDRRMRLNKRLIRSYNEEIAPAVYEARAKAGMSLDDGRVYPFGQSTRAIASSAEGSYAAGFYEETPCYAPFLHMFVAWDGKVYLCCMTNGRINALGDLSQQSVRDVFCGAPFQAIRSRMLQQRLGACSKCDMMLEENRLLHQTLPARSSSRRILPLIA